MSTALPSAEIRHWLGWSATGLAALALVAGAAYAGYRSEMRSPVGDDEEKTQSNASVALSRIPEAERSAGSGRSSGQRPAMDLGAAVSSPMPVPKPGENLELTWPLWEFVLRQPIPPRTPPLTPPPWRMIGATQSAGSWSIIILRQGKSAPEYYKVGDNLPGDYRIDAITEEDVTLVHKGRALILSYIGSR